MTDKIDSRSQGHDNYVRTVLRTIVSLEHYENGQPVPEDFLMIGTDWLYMGKVEINGFSFTINPVNKLGIVKPISLAEVLGHFYSQTDRLGLIPEGEDRMREARNLGEVVDEREFYFRVRKEEQEISVYRIRDATHTESEINPGVGFTSFPGHK